MGIYDGMNKSALQARLAALQDAYFELLSGKQVASASYAQSDGSKSVTFRAADLSRLQADITLLQQKLGIVRHARRPINFVMR